MQPRTGSSWDTQNYVTLGDYLGASITIADVNRDGKMDFFVPTEVTLTRLQDSSAQNQTYLLVDNLREVNTVEIILGDPNGNGYFIALLRRWPPTDNGSSRTTCRRREQCLRDSHWTKRQVIPIR